MKMLGRLPNRPKRRLRPGPDAWRRHAAVLTSSRQRLTGPGLTGPGGRLLTAGAYPTTSLRCDISATESATTCRGAKRHRRYDETGDPSPGSHEEPLGILPARPSS